MNKYDKLQSKLMRYQTKIYHITLKYDPTTTVYNYQDLSIYWIEFMTSLDRFKIKWYSKRVLKILKKMEKEKSKGKIEPPSDYEK